MKKEYYRSFEEFLELYLIPEFVESQDAFLVITYKRKSKKYGPFIQDKYGKTKHWMDWTIKNFEEAQKIFRRTIDLLVEGYGQIFFEIDGKTETLKIYSPERMHEEDFENEIKQNASNSVSS